MKIEKNVSLKPYNTFGIDKVASHFTAVTTEEELLEAIRFAKSHQLPLFILGGGSNILLTTDIAGLVVKIDLLGIDITEETHEEVVVTVGAGVVWHDFVLHTISQGWGGIENLSLIPGTVGASPMQNIGAYGVELKETFLELQALEIDSLQKHTFDKSSCDFGYRDSIFKRRAKGKYIITSVCFKLSKMPKFNVEYGDIKRTLENQGIKDLSLEAISKAIIQIRQSKLPDPKEIGNAGSFFKNPVVPKEKFRDLQGMFPNIPGFPQHDGVKIPAAWLIEQAGWKGKRRGSVGVHPKQPLVLVNYGGAVGGELLALSKEIAKDIEQKYGVTLKPEVNVI
jgi:UDP-N-acetylmuramate dehydrogenase